MKNSISFFILITFTAVIINCRNLLAQTKVLNGFTYTGEFFDDPDWGKSYNTSEQDRKLLSRAHFLMKESLKRLLGYQGDYEMELTDMSSAFDSLRQEEDRKNGKKCVTCYYSHNPGTGEYFQYAINLRLNMIEESELFRKKALRDDSLSKKVIGATTTVSREMTEKQLQSEIEKLQKEIAAVDYNNITEQQLAEVERKGKRIEQLAAGSAGIKVISDDSVHAIYSESYAPVVHLTIRTNAPMIIADKTGLLVLNNNPDYYFKELKIPGCAFACIYFDKYNKSTELAHSSQPVFMAYIGTIYPGSQALPKAWLNPFCVRVTFSGNLEQIKAISEKIDFTKLASIIH